LYSAGADGKDLIYEGIATGNYPDQVYVETQEDGKDLIYEGIATEKGFSCCGSILEDGKDLIYEGIATLRRNARW